jgi:hypothetical protein
MRYFCKEYSGFRDYETLICGLLGYEVTYVVTKVLEEPVAYVFRWRFIVLMTFRNLVLLSSFRTLSLRYRIYYFPVLFLV